VKKVLIIAEAGVNHNGSLDIALKLCDEAKYAGADAVKFQTFKTEKILTKNVRMADYQKKNIGTDVTQFEMIKKLELSYKDFEIIKRHCDKIGIMFLSTPDEEESLDFLISLGINIIKIGSGDVDNLPYLKTVGQKNKDVILSTGMSYLGEVEKAFFTLIENGAKTVTLLHCTTNYPCPYEEVNLKAMNTLKNAFNVKVGYSDHTLGVDVPIAAVALGADVIEKHFTLDNNMEGPDHKASLNPTDLGRMIEAIRNIEKSLGNGIKIPNPSEESIKRIVRKYIVAQSHINKGDLFSEKNLTVKRAMAGKLPANFWDQVIGRISDREFFQDEEITL